MDEATLDRRIAALSPDKRALLEQRLREQRARADSYEIAPTQQGLWFLEQLVPGSSLYSVPWLWRLRGPLDPAILARALSAVVERHAVLRSRFPTDGSQRVTIAPLTPVELPLIDLGALPPAEREARLQRHAAIEAARPFDLRRDPLLRAWLVRLHSAGAPPEHALVINVHHLVFDGWSTTILLRELLAHYTAFSDGRPSPLPPLAVQYGDFAAWQRQQLQGAALEAQLAYWRAQLAGSPVVLELPNDCPRPVAQSYAGAITTIDLPAELLEPLQELARGERSTLFMLLLAAWQVLLARWSGQTDIAVATPVAGRSRSELEVLIGFFINTIVVRTRLDDRRSFRELLAEVRETTLQAYAHQDLPFDRLVEALRPERSLSYNPLVQVSFAVEDESPPLDLPPGLAVGPLEELSTNTTKFDISWTVVAGTANFSAKIEYSTDLFDAATIERLAQCYATLLAGIVADPGRRIADLDLLTAAERARQVITWNATTRPYPEECLHTRFAAQALRTPEAVALLFEDEQLSYRELLQRVVQLAAHLRALGVGVHPRDELRVGLLVERSFEMIAGMLAILAAGGCYVPLDPTHPADRLRFMAEDAEIAVLLTQSQLRDLLMLPDVSTLDLDTISWAHHDAPIALPPNTATVDHLAYIIYTSGSTGRPKGTLISHRAVSNFVSSCQSDFPVGPSDTMLQFASFGFDVSVFEIFTALLSGARLVLAPRATLLDPARLTALMRHHRVTIFDIPPAVLQLLPPDMFPDVRVMFVGCEAFSGDLVNRWARSGRRFINGYGPTEATVAMTVFDCRGEYQQMPPIGHPMPNHHVYVLDHNLQLLPIGAPGQLYVGGVGLARGYHRRPDLTAEKFIPNPFDGEDVGLSPKQPPIPNPTSPIQNGARLYATGDLVRWLPEGELQFLGRIDQQVKIRGFRVELGEIEAALRRHPQVREAAVAVRETTHAGAPSAKRLVAYVVPHERATAEAFGEAFGSSLRASLSDLLPQYMVPSAFVVLDALPLNASGKVDRKALPEPGAAGVAPSTAFAAPRTILEVTIARIWCAVLGVEQVGIHDNFFALGGHSLLATQCVIRLRDALKHDLSLQSFFEAATVAQLAELCAAPAADARQAQRPALRAFGRDAYRAKRSALPRSDRPAEEDDHA